MLPYERGTFTLPFTRTVTALTFVVVSRSAAGVAVAVGGGFQTVGRRYGTSPGGTGWSRTASACPPRPRKASSAGPPGRRRRRPGAGRRASTPATRTTTTAEERAPAPRSTRSSTGCRRAVPPGPRPSWIPRAPRCRAARVPPGSAPRPDSGRGRTAATPRRRVRAGRGRAAGSRAATQRARRRDCRAAG